MKKLLFLLIPALVIAAAVFFLLPEDEGFVLPEHILICLDPGHGGDDPGAVLGDRLEKDDNLALALAVRDKLENAGREDLSVALTRSDDTALELQQRVDLANGMDATLFISLHRNSGGGTGFETWVSADGETFETRLATYIQDNLTAIDGVKDRGVRRGTAGNPAASYTVVGRTEMPACLVEMGFLDSDSDNALLDAQFGALAQAIADGILRMVERP